MPANYVENGLTDTDQRLNLAQDPYFGLAIGELPIFAHLLMASGGKLYQMRTLILNRVS